MIWLCYYFNPIRYRALNGSHKMQFHLSSKTNNFEN
jgi:hypothetical protein